jgi:hypothetical protein
LLFLASFFSAHVRAGDFTTAKALGSWSHREARRYRARRRLPRVRHSIEAAFKNAKPVHFKGNIALVLKYFDKLAPLMPDQDSNLRPAD